MPVRVSMPVPSHSSVLIVSPRPMPTRSASIDCALRRDDLRHGAVRAHELAHFLAEVQVHAVRARRVVQQLARSFVQHPPQKARSADQPVRLDAARYERFGELVRDERSADGDADLRRLERLRDRQRLVHVLEVVHVAGARGAGRARGIRPSAGREEKRVPRLLAAGGSDRSRRDVDAVDARRQPQIDPVLLVPCDVAHDHFLLRDLLAQQRRECNPIVETVRFVGEEDDGTSRVRLTKLLRAGGSCKSVADDDIPTIRHDASD